MNKATLTCPMCSAQQSIEVPEDACLSRYTCDSCHELITSASKDGSCACILCEFSDTTCPMEK